MERFTKLFINNNNNNNDDESSNNKEGKDAIFSNIIACISIGEIMKSLLGPKSRDKLIINKFNEIIVTNDGSTVLKSIKLEHPVCKMMVELSSSMDDQNGDGTTSVVVLSSFLLRKSLKLLNGSITNNNNGSTTTTTTTATSIHPIKIINGFIKASKITIDTINSLSKSFDIHSENGKNLMLQTCKTTLNSKLISHTNPILSRLAVDSILMVSSSTTSSYISTDSINIISIQGESVEKSKIYPYFILPYTFITPFYNNNNNNSNGGDIKVLFLNILFSKNSSNNVVGNTNNNDNDNIEQLINQEENNIKSIVISLKKMGISIIGIIEDLNYSTSANISNLLLSYLNKAKISVLKPFSFEKMKYLSNKLNIPIINDQFQIKQQKQVQVIQQQTQVQQTSQLLFKSFKSIKCELINNENLIHFEMTSTSTTTTTTDTLGTSSNSSNEIINPTILLRGTTDMELKETERALHDALCVLRNLVRNPIVVPGGSASEIESSKRIYEFYNNTISSSNSNSSSSGNNISRQELLSMLSFADSLEEISETLCQNSGIDNHLEVVLKLKQSHKDNNNNNGNNIGIDLKINTIGDMFEYGVLETLSNKLAQITMATEIVTNILKIDEIIYCK